MISPGIVLMTALPPTKGHIQLIKFAAEYMRTIGSSLHVIVSSRDSIEPMDGETRRRLIYEEIDQPWYRANIITYVHQDDDAPQNPPVDGDVEPFWEYWCNVVKTFVPFDEYDPIVDMTKPILFASEQYGLEFAKRLGAEFVPFDINREVVDAKATRFREDPIENFTMLPFSVQKYYQKTVTIFGAESVGKTTLAKSLCDGEFGPWQFVPEWARTYLESVGPEITPEKMSTIARGQHALQKSAKQIVDKTVIIQDTDLLSTIGYYRIFAAQKAGVDPDTIGAVEPRWVKYLFEQTKSDLYIVPPSNIPFVPDWLRYGGDKRESTDQFWINLLEEYDCNYWALRSPNRNGRRWDCADVIEALLLKTYAPLRSFKREVI